MVCTPTTVPYFCLALHPRLAPTLHRPAVRGALHGSLALLSRHPAAAAADAASPLAAQPQPQLPAPDDAAAVEVMRTCVSHVFVSALAAPDRQLALRLLAAAVRGYGPALLGANLDLLEYTVSSGGWVVEMGRQGQVAAAGCMFMMHGGASAAGNMLSPAGTSSAPPLQRIPTPLPLFPPSLPAVDGEKDPRCLLLGFEAVRALLALYHAQPDTSLCHERLEVRCLPA